MNPPPCPAPLELEEYLEGSATADRTREIDAHLEGCSTCSGWLERAHEEERLLSEVRSAVSSGAAGPGGADCALPAEPDLARYEILRRLGAGGMGIVYEARQRSPSRTVALKVLQPRRTSRRALRRFEHEAELLGRLDHPGVARVYEAGTWESPAGPQPFLAMELVRGVTLTAFARERGLGTAERLRLLAEVCDAVQHAHQQGVIHRDLKPSNVLVTDAGRPVVLDFGVARAVGADDDGSGTLSGELLGTLAYMSPEQAAGHPVDTRADVYALGAVLYELVAGRTPLVLEGLPVAEALRKLEHEDPPPLRGAVPGVARDLEAVAAKALAKEPERRYAGAAELAADLRRSLRHEPVEARPATAAYQLARFARRNRVLVGGATLVLAALVLGVVATRSQARRAQRAERFASAQLDAARLERDRARAMLAFLQDLLAEPDPEGGGRHPDTPLRVVLDDAALRLAGAFPDDPATEAELRVTLGRAFLNHRLFERAEASLERALELRRVADGERSLGVAAALGGLGVLRTRQRRFDEARDLLERALAIVDGGDDPRATAAVLHDLAALAFEEGDRAGARELLAQAQALRARHLGADDADRMEARLFEALVVELDGDPAEAERLLRDGLVWAEEARGPRHPTTAAFAKGLADLVVRTDDSPARRDDAVALYREALATFSETLGEDHPRWAGCAAALGHALFPVAPSEAEELFRRALPGLREALPPDDGFLDDTRKGLVFLLVRGGALGEAIERQRDWLSDFDAHPDFEAHPGAAALARGGLELDLGRSLAAAGRREEAREALRAAVATLDLAEGAAERLAVARAALAALGG